MKRLLNLLCLSLLILNASAQDTQAVSNDSLLKSINAVKKDVDILKNMKISGWVQAQYQYADTNGAKNFDGGDFPSGSNQRFFIRRGRIKFTYTQKNSQYVIQLNGSERGFNLVEIFAKAIDPWTHAFSLTAGVMNRPFGFEIQQSSSDRESPERSRWTQSVMQNERDLGAMVSFQPQKGKMLYGLKVDAGFYNGEGIAVPGTGGLSGTAQASGITGVNGVTDFDSYKDFIGHAVYYNHTKDEKIKYGIGVSHYNGGFAYQTNKVFTSIKTDTLGNKVWVIGGDTANVAFKNKKAPRIYNGVEAFFSIKTGIGTTTLRGEYFFGTQTGKDNDSRSPQAAPSSNDAMFVRNFDAGYAYFIQRIAKSKHEVVFKYEWYDPNTKISSGDLNGKNGMKEGEIKFTMMGVGYNFYLDNNLKFMFNYNIVANEKGQIKGYTYDRKDNIFTARIQYKF